MSRVKAPVARTSTMPVPSASSPPRRKAKPRMTTAAEPVTENGEMNIQVVVRCRGRSAMEISQRTPAILSTQGAVSSSISVETPSTVGSTTAGMGLSVSTLPYSDRSPVSRTYSFDRVFGPEADQTLVFREVAEKALDEVLCGYNCTIFAYGQTGTGKTYTMAGDLSLTPMGTPTSEAGIIPRTLHRLFSLLEAQSVEFSVKCSYIELYNEELRDLLASDFQQPTALGGTSQSGQTGLKIYDDAQKKGVMIQNLEETSIRSPAEGLALLLKGSQRRQVAETKMNTESSRSHSIFNLTVHMKDTAISGGEDVLRCGKLNLVDLAGSEAIGRSGAANQRAREAGMINQSLLTLGRVITALVDKSSHVPYRESKLTRLLQDSLGGRTKTTILATVSPTRSNLEETLSTLDYALRARTIKNKPELNQRLTKAAVLKEYNAEIEKLKSDLQAAYEKNGVFLSAETYAAMNEDHENAKTDLAEATQRANALEQKYETMQAEFQASMTMLLATQEDLRVARVQAETFEALLAETRAGLERTKLLLEEEQFVSKAYQIGEQRIDAVAKELKVAVGASVKDVGGLFAKIGRKAAVLSDNETLTATYANRVQAAADDLLLQINDIKNVQADFGLTLQSELEAFAKRGAASLDDDKRLLDERLSAFVKDAASFDKLQAEHDDRAVTIALELRSAQELLSQRIESWSSDVMAIASSASAKLTEQSQANVDRITASVAHIAEITTIAIDGALEHSTEEIKTARYLDQQTAMAASKEVARLEARNAQLERMLATQATTSSRAQQELVNQISTLITAYTANQQATLVKEVAAVQQDQTESREQLANFAATHQSTVQASEQRFEQYQKDLDALKTASSAQVEEAGEVLAQGQAAIALEAEKNASAVKGTLNALRSEVMEPHAKQVDESIEHGAVEAQRFASAHRTELESMTGRVQDTYALAKDRLVISKQDSKDVSALVLAAHAAAGPTLDERTSQARSTVEAVRSSHAEFTASLKQDIPTGETPRKKAWPAVEATWESTAPRDVLIERFRRTAMAGEQEGIEQQAAAAAAATDVALPDSPTVSESASSDVAAAVASPQEPLLSIAHENVPTATTAAVAPLMSKIPSTSSTTSSTGNSKQSALNKSTLTSTAGSRLARSTNTSSSAPPPSREALASNGASTVAGSTGIKPRRI